MVFHKSYEDALKEFQEAVRFDSDNDVYRFNLGNTLEKLKNMRKRLAIIRQRLY